VALVHVRFFSPYQEYPVVHAERVNTRHVRSVLLAIIENSNNSVKVFLPSRYGEVVSDVDIEDINSHRVLLYLIYKGTCSKSNSYVLEIHYQQVP